MALQILEYNGTFYLKGALTTTTSNSFIMHFKHVFKNIQDVTLHIDKVKEIDKSGVNALKQIHMNAQKNNKQFSIIGYGCKDIYDEFKYDHVA